MATPPFMLFISAVRLLMEPAWSIVEGPFLADLTQSSLVFARARLAGEVKRQVGRLSGTTLLPPGAALTPRLLPPGVTQPLRLPAAVQHLPLCV